MEGGYHSRYQTDNIRTVHKAGGCQHIQLLHKPFHIKRNGLSNVNQLIGRGGHSLLCHQLFLIQLFSRAQTCIHNLDILVRLVA